MNIQTDITLAVFQSVKTVGGEGGWGERFKRPIDFRESESVTSPFYEGESQTQQGCHKRLYLLNKHPYSALFVSPSRRGLFRRLIKPLTHVRGFWVETTCSEPRDGVETKYNFVNSILVY